MTAKSISLVYKANALRMDTETEDIRRRLAKKSLGTDFRPEIHWPEIRVSGSKSFPPIPLAEMRYVGRLFLLDGLSALSFREKKGLSPEEIFEIELWRLHERLFSLDSYVICPDQMYLMIRPLENRDPLGIFGMVRKIAARAFNDAHSREGAVFDDKIEINRVDTDQEWLIRFLDIHFLPVKKGCARLPRDYPYSSLVTLHCEGAMDSPPQIAPLK